MEGRKVTHVGFADESNWNVGRFRSLGLVTTSLAQLDYLNNQLVVLLSESSIAEVKWQSLSGAREQFAAQKLCNFAIEQACKGVLRVDVLVWDIEDSRHKVRGRDDVANLQRMYYHLFRNVLRLRWSNDALWKLHPDEHTAIDWDAIQDLLESVSTRIEIESSIFDQGGFRLRLKRDFGIEEIQPVISREQPLLQLADLFAGLAVFSREKFIEYRQWLEDNSEQLSFIEKDENANDFSRRTKVRFQVLKEFAATCKLRKLGVSLKSSQGLRTPNPRKPINFWLYEPQHPEDKAPTKRSDSYL